MASIKKIEGKTGTSFKITVTRGRDSRGKQIRHFKTWTPDRPMTARQMEREVKRVAVDFEREIELGYQADNRQTVEQYAWYVIGLRERQGAAKRTLATYHYFMERVVPALGHLKLSEVRPQHLNAFYRDLGAAGARKKEDMAVPKVNFRALLVGRGMTQGAFARASHISHTMVERLCHGEHISLKRAEYIADFLGEKTRDLFKIERDTGGLSHGTIRRFHGFLSIVFAQAEKEMIIPYNPAKRASPPGREESAPNYFQPEQVEQILKALETEGIKHRTMVHLFIVTGCRLGEIVGLKWEKVDFDNKQIKIDCCLGYTPKTGVFEGPTKTKNTRFVALPEETVAMLRKYRAWYLEQQLLNGDRWNRTGYLFTKDDGSPIIPGTVNGWLDRFSKRHGLPHINPHSFRHTAASILISEGVDIVTVSKMLGHANPSMTTDTYSHIIEDAKRKATECVADVILRRKKA